MKQSTIEKKRLKILKYIFLCQARTYDKDLAEIYSLDLKKIVHEYNDIIADLIKDDLIIVNSSYHVGDSKTKGYCKKYGLNYKNILEHELIRSIANSDIGKYDRIDEKLSQAESLRELQVKMSDYPPQNYKSKYLLALKSGLLFLNRSKNCRRVFSNVVNLMNTKRAIMNKSKIKKR